MIDLEIPKKFVPLVKQAGSVADEVFRPIARKYDIAEHAHPTELDLLSAVVDGLNASGTGTGAGATGASQTTSEPAGVGAGTTEKKDGGGVKNGTNMSSALSIMETCRGDVGLTLALPRQGLGNAAIAAVATPEQKARYEGKWAAMAITEPEAGSDAAAIRTTAVKDGDHYVLNGTKIYVTAGERAD
ncbi:MAG: acyl-CoA dehydrogenase family protein, partial [Solirubrobacteraceae bacterium]|nr:acyl-CoA dehydrogenase family protein [Solirubrobacteraceae bacterium]